MRCLLKFAFPVLFLNFGCSTTFPPPTNAQWISLETSSGPFCGRCDSTKIFVLYDGGVWIEQGHWAGNYRDWRVHRRKSQVSPEALANFRARLDAFRPEGTRWLRDPEDCSSYWTDQPEVKIVWRDDKGDAPLWYNFGCDQEKFREMADALKSAPALLEISNLSIPEWGL